MKYLYFIYMVVDTIFRKIFGLVWYWFVVPFRGIARHKVYAYSLENGIKIKRLEERFPVKVLEGWELQDIHGVGRKGFVHYEDVSAISFYLWLHLAWRWLDDDSNEDTFAAGHNRRYISGDLKDSWQNKLFGKYLIKANNESTYGNTFDLGDLRAVKPNFEFFSALLWNTRNTAYNFSYMFNTTSDEWKVFEFSIFGFKFGWIPDGEVNGVRYYSLFLGKNF